VSAACLQSSAGILSLLLWWGATARLAVDSILQLGWEALRSHIPLARRAVKVHPEAAQDAATHLHGGADTVGSLAVQQWWRDREADTLADTLRLERGCLRSAAITSATGRVFRLSGSRFEQIQRVSADGVHFPSDPSEFKQEALISDLSDYPRPVQPGKGVPLFHGPWVFRASGPAHGSGGILLPGLWVTG
jgi:hypothetical protein